jgi:cell division protein FtsI/penicillin-binding protein 2
MNYTRNDTAKWRQFQTRFQHRERIKLYKKRLPVFLSILAGCAGLFFLIYTAGNGISGNPGPKANREGISAQKKNPPPRQSNKTDLAPILKEAFGDPTQLTNEWGVERNGSQLTVKTTIDVKLQKYIAGLLKRPRTVQSAVVVLNPYDGRIVAMASYDMNGNTDNLCLKADFPAASIFKIISAAAAFETAGYWPDKPLVYAGRRHTLYKYQLESSTKRHTRKTKFRKAFANSNNPVFGKLGIYDLGQEALNEYADRFFFNQMIPFDYPTSASRIDVPEHDFGLAEIASGFNKQTLISPLHAALLAAVVVNNGEMVTPWLVQHVTNQGGETLYQAECKMQEPPIRSNTAAELRVLMNDAVVSGTSRSAFSKIRRKRKFKSLILGAKTGTINDEQDQYKYDWITAYALKPDSTEGICISVLGVHGEILGVRSTEFARAIIDFYYSSKRDPK